MRGLALPGVLGVLARSADFGESPSTLESSSNMARMFALAFSLLFGVIIAAAPEDLPARLSTGCPVAAARKFQATALGLPRLQQRFRLVSLFQAFGISVLLHVGLIDSHVSVLFIESFAGCTRADPKT